MDVTIESRCPYGHGFICVLGIRYKQIPDAAAAPQEGIPADLPGLMYEGRCDCCEKITPVRGDAR